MRFLCLLIIALTLTSCSVPRTRNQRLYSEETNSSFEDIERGRILEYYKKLRAETATKKRKKTKKVRRRAQRKITKKRKIHLVDAREQRIEVKQTLIFFCMQNRKTDRFHNQDECKTFTDTTIQSCRMKYSWNDRALFKCIKSSLN